MKKILIAIIITLACEGVVSGADTGGNTINAIAPAGVTATAVGVTKVAVLKAEDVDEGQAAYDSITTTPDFNYRPAFVETRYAKNELFQDIAVSAVEAVPFGFILTFLGIFVYEAIEQSSFKPVLKTLQAYTPVYAVSIGSLAAANVLINTLFFYDYKEEDSRGKKTEEK